MFSCLVGRLPGLWVGELLERKWVRERECGGAIRKVLAYIFLFKWSIVPTILSYTNNYTQVEVKMLHVHRFTYRILSHGPRGASVSKMCFRSNNRNIFMI